MGMFRLFCHETSRVFHDRLIDNQDKTYFNNMLAEIAGKHFRQDVDGDSFDEKPIMFGDFMKIGAEKADKIYDDLTDIMPKVKTVMEDYLDDYNMNSSKEMRLGKSLSDWLVSLTPPFDWLYQLDSAIYRPPASIKMILSTNHLCIFQYFSAMQLNTSAELYV